MLFKTLTGDEGEDLDLDAPKIYEPIESYEQLSDRFKMFQSQYNEVVRGSQMDLVFFKVHIQREV